MIQPSCTADCQCLANVGGHHHGPICIKTMHFGSRHFKVTVIVCANTGEVMNSALLAEAYNLDPVKQVEVYHLQQLCPSAIPGYPFSSDSDDDGTATIRSSRVQPCTDAILANLQPRSTRYSDACKDYLLHACDAYSADTCFASGQTNAR